MVGAISTALQGMNGALERLNTSAARIANFGTQNPASSTAPIDEINLSEEAVNMMIAKTSYKANIAVLNTQRDMEDALLRVFDEEV